MVLRDFPASRICLPGLLIASWSPCRKRQRLCSTTFANPTLGSQRLERLQLLRRPESPPPNPCPSAWCASERNVPNVQMPFIRPAKHKKEGKQLQACNCKPRVSQHSPNVVLTFQLAQHSLQMIQHSLQKLPTEPQVAQHSSDVASNWPHIAFQWSNIASKKLPTKPRLN